MKITQEIKAAYQSFQEAVAKYPNMAIGQVKYNKFQKLCLDANLSASEVIKAIELDQKIADTITLTSEEWYAKYKHCGDFYAYQEEALKRRVHIYGATPSVELVAKMMEDAAMISDSDFVNKYHITIAAFHQAMAPSGKQLDLSTAVDPELEKFFNSYSGILVDVSEGYEHTKEFKRASSLCQRRWNRFAEACESKGLKPSEYAAFLRERKESSKIKLCPHQQEAVNQMEEEGNQIQGIKPSAAWIDEAPMMKFEDLERDTKFTTSKNLLTGEEGSFNYVIIDKNTASRTFKIYHKLGTPEITVRFEDVDVILNNLKPADQLRPYQQQASTRQTFNFGHDEGKSKELHKVQVLEWFKNNPAKEAINLNRLEKLAGVSRSTFQNFFVYQRGISDESFTKLLPFVRAFGFVRVTAERTSHE